MVGCPLPSSILPSDPIVELILREGIGHWTIALTDDEFDEWFDEQNAAWKRATNHEKLRHTLDYLKQLQTELAANPHDALLQACIPFLRIDERRYVYRVTCMTPPGRLHRRQRQRRGGSRRRAVRRTSGSRGDPPDGDPEPASALSAAVTAPAHALNDGNSPYTRADRARGSRPVFVLYERHPVHGLINRPLGRFLAGQR